MTQRNLLGTLSFAILGLTAELPAQQQPLRGFDDYVARAVSDWRVPGLSIAVVKDDSVVFLKGYGVHELGKPDPVTVHTRFGVMSTTKAFTTMLLAMLADSGKLAWDDPATRYLPELALKDPWVTRELSLRDLVTHRIGFPDPGYLWYGESLDVAELMRRLRLVPAASSMRSQFAYNNVAYALAGEIAARAAGGGGGGTTSWQALVHSRIYEPLGMSESYPDERELRAAGITDVTAPHGIVNDTVRRLPITAALVDPIAPAGAMFSSAADMARWLRFLLDSGRVGGGVRRLVSPRNFQQLFTPQQVVPPREFYPTARLTRPHFQAYGLGWFLEDYRGEFVAFHTGSIDGRSAIVGLLPDRRLGVAIFTNLDHSELRHALMYTVFDRYLGPQPGVQHDWSIEMRTLYQALRDSALARRGTREAARVMGTHPTLPLEQYVGVYADSLFGVARIQLEAGRLTLQLGEQTGALEHWQYDLFRVNWRQPLNDPGYLRFTLDADGKVGELSVLDSPLRFRRSQKGAQAP
jgi:CubicO group peptidase (beta-lactamase class C family)